MGNQIIIREMNLDDYNDIKDILIDDFDSFWNPNILKEELLLDSSKYFVSIFNNEIVGFAGIKIVLDSADIMNIVTKKTYRKHGIASLLLNKLIFYSKESNIKNLFLEVSESNIPAINLYAKYNFKKLGIRKNYYEKNNGINMMLEIN